MGVNGSENHRRLDPVETPIVLGLVIMVLGISLGSVPVMSFGALVIVASAVLNLLFSHDELGHNGSTNSHAH